MARITNKAAAKRAGVTTRTLSRWDDRLEEVGYAKAHYVLGRIYRETDEIEVFEAKNPDFSPSRKAKQPPVHRTKQTKQAKAKDKAERERAIARRDKRQQALPEIGTPEVGK